MLWALPLLQLALLAFFSWTAVEHVWCADQALSVSFSLFFVADQRRARGVAGRLL